MHPHNLASPAYTTRRDRPKSAEVVHEAARPLRVDACPHRANEYELKDTISTDSFGKLKYAENFITGEKFAVKRICRNPHRHSRPRMSGTSDLPKKNVITARVGKEGALGRLLHHPHIVRMKKVLVHHHHYYLVFEYVSRVTLLDYVIQHGRLQDAEARKFARQIGSALEYCHDNNIVHRDLKMESIFVSDEGDAKITNFTLASLYEPGVPLSDLCGSGYFPAPELLRQKSYDGTKIDVWSFGVILYTLLCGRAPFDDVSMMAMREKIKTKDVTYPRHLSRDAKDLLSLLLSKDPAARPSTKEVLSHPWMLQGYSGPPSSPLASRVPLQAHSFKGPSQLQKNLIASMRGFELGTAEAKETRLLEILESDAYREAVEAWQQQHSNPEDEKSGSKGAFTSDVMSWEYGYKESNDSMVSQSSGIINRLRGRFQRPSSSPEKSTELPAYSESSLPPYTLTSSDSKGLQLDPTRGYHPLLSLYYLVQEKKAREMTLGPDYFPAKWEGYRDEEPSYSVPEQERVDWKGLVASLWCL